MELYEAIAHYIGRQQLVVRTVIERGVNPAELRGVGAWHDKTEQIGDWGADWRFFFHGGGCRLTHRITKEPIDWDGPDPYRFDPFFFIHHLEWRCAQGHNLPHLCAFLKEHDAPVDTYRLIEDLIKDGIVSSGCRLNSPDSLKKASVE